MLPLCPLSADTQAGWGGGAGAEGAEGQAWLMGRTGWVMGVSGWAEAGGWVGACSCSLVAQGPPGDLALPLQALNRLLAPSWWRPSSPGSIS